MNLLIEQLQKALPKGITIPQPLIRLYEWIESNSLYRDLEDGTRVGFLYPEEKMRASWTENEREGGTDIGFFAQSQDHLKFWFGKESDEIYGRLCVFGKTGGDGSECALWLDDDGNTQIVHMGSGSGSILCCVLADNAIDFLRLLAIGYDEICWNELYEFSPNEQEGVDFIVHPNVEFQNWVKSTFDVEIPKTALEIVKYPVEMGDKNTPDTFCNWCNAQTTYSDE